MAKIVFLFLKHTFCGYFFYFKLIFCNRVLECRTDVASSRGMDFLSYKTLEKRGDNVICIQEPCDYIVLNSISSLGKCMERLACYTAIHCYLDNDQAGAMAVHTIMEHYQNKAINESIRYAEYKDVNDYLIGRKSIIPHKEDV